MYASTSVFSCLILLSSITSVFDYLNALRRILKSDSLRRQLVSDLIGACVILRLSRGLTLIDQRLDLRLYLNLFFNVLLKAITT